MREREEVNIDQVLKDAEEAKKIIANSLKHLELMAGEFKDRKAYHKLIEDELRKDWELMQGYIMKYPNSRFFAADEVVVTAFHSLPRETYRSIYCSEEIEREHRRLANLSKRYGLNLHLY